LLSGIRDVRSIIIRNIKVNINAAQRFETSVILTAISPAGMKEKLLIVIIRPEKPVACGIPRTWAEELISPESLKEIAGLESRFIMKKNDRKIIKDWKEVFEGIE
jgi:hypothetical protein